jgi:hypothetical protein
MMNMNRLLPFLCGLVLVAVLFTAGCTTIPGGTATPAPTVPAASPTPDLSTCGFTTCHGTDLICGLNAPQICTMEYQIGDKCRQYARCDTTGGSCTLVTTQQFVSCKACADNCQIQAGPDSLAAMTCEEKC